ncbi:hypothetical protein NP493_109g00000 [Ridgeia piscesae]|uniref:ATP-dependent RNA helicase n=1 Tax=Ridgeia piscesae TaxID=27915 RepID=A0AAD9P7A2_RIDPI|nr:hypothetical protein NP493_109g00000 [Ridgeia piscesae]
MAFSVVAKSGWRKVSLPPEFFQKGGAEGLMCIDELTDYELVKGVYLADNKAKVGKKQGAKKNKNISKLQTEATTTDGTEERSSVKENKSSQSKKKKLAEKKKADIFQKRLNKKKQKEITQLSKDGKDISSDPVHTQKMGRLNTKEGKVMKKTGKFNAKKGKAAKPTGKFITGKNVVNIWDEEEKIEEESHVTQEEGARTQKRKRSGPGMTCYILRMGQTGAADGPRKKKKKNNPAEKRKEEAKRREIREGQGKKVKDMSAWDNLFVPPDVLTALSDMGFSSPTPIQALALPSAIRDVQDIVGAAETGSGKTLAFAIPVIHHILKYREQQKTKSSHLAGQQEDSGVSSGNDGSDSDINDEFVGNEENTSDGENEEVDESGDVEDVLAEDTEDGQSEESEEEEEEFEESDECDLTPDEDEEMGDLEDGEMGCVKVLKDVTFDWLEKTPSQPKKPQVSDRPLLALVLTPTRELAVQVKDHIEAVARHTDIRTVTVIGGMASQKQERLLRKCPEIVVATPGRLWELIQMGNEHLAKVTDVQCLVVDEADRMVEKGHFEELSNLLEYINDDEKKLARRQTFVFSATLTMAHGGPRRIMKKKKVKFTPEQKLEMLMTQIGVKERPKVIDLTQKSGTAGALTEARINCSKADEKDLYVYYFLLRYPGRTIVFANSKDCIRRLVSIFTLLECQPLPLHADMHQRQRLRNLDRFKANWKGLLLTTDVAARGLDIPDVQHVLHYQVSRTTENYVHRSGRTARASKEGLSVMLVGPEDLKNYRKIVLALNRDEELPIFPVESDYMAGVKARVNLARQIDKEEHIMTKRRKQNSWFEKAAKEMDIELDEEELLHDLGDSMEQSQQRQRLAQLRHLLVVMLRQPMVTQHFSSKYPTKSGKLRLPFMRGWLQPSVG